MRGRNREFIVAGIKNLLERNYRLESDLYDIEAEVDSTLTFQENWYQFKEKYQISVIMLIIRRC